MLEAAMAWSNDDLSAFEVNVKHCLQIRNQPDNELTHLLEQALHKLRGQEIQVLVLRETLRAILATNSELATRMKGFELMEARLREHVQLVTQQRNGLRQQLRNTQEHRRRLSQQIMEAQDISLQVLRDCVREIDRVPAQGVQQLVRAINYHIQPVLEEEGEDIIEVTPEPKICEIVQLLIKIIRALLRGQDKQGGENRTKEERTGHREERTEHREKRTGHREERTGHREERTGLREERTGHREGRRGHREGRRGHREGRTGHREERTGHREGRTGHREGRTGHREERTGHREERTGHREERTGHREERTGHREERTGHREERTGYRSPGTEERGFT
ncbi:unnamed protein product [Closterium sp. NIES-53]